MKIKFNRSKLKAQVRRQKRALGHKLSYAAELLFQACPKSEEHWIRTGKFRFFKDVAKQVG